MSTCVICRREIEPAPLYFTSDGEPRHMLCGRPRDERPVFPAGGSTVGNKKLSLGQREIEKRRALPLLDASSDNPLEASIARLRQMHEPSDLEYAIHDRVMLNVVAFGPLTLAEHESVEAYERYQEESAVEHEAQLAAGGRTLCPKCGERSVTHRTVCTYGYAGHPGADYSDLASCERCDYTEV